MNNSSILPKIPLERNNSPVKYQTKAIELNELIKKRNEPSYKRTVIMDKLMRN